MQPLPRTQALQRWAGAVELQRLMLHYGSRDPEQCAQQAVELGRRFDAVFPAPQALMQFWQEVKKLSWPATAGTSPWEDLASMGADLCNGRTLLENAPPGGYWPPAQMLRARADYEFSRERQGQGYPFVVQTCARGAPTWTSRVLWATSGEDVQREFEAARRSSPSGTACWAARLHPHKAPATVIVARTERGHPGFDPRFRHMLDPDDAAGAPAFDLPPAYARAQIGVQHVSDQAAAEVATQTDEEQEAVQPVRQRFAMG